MPIDTAATVDIVMGTYNGARYVADQIGSLQAQGFADWRLLVRDDGSTDGTPELLATLATGDARIRIVGDPPGNLGVGANFAYLLGLTTAPYAMYCDQDDRWLPDKIARSLARMRETEGAHPGLPVLVHADAMVVDAELRTIRPRFIGHNGGRRGLAGLLFQNTAQGASILMNGALRRLVLETPSTVPYDYHAALVAEAVGVRRFLDEPLLLYRQHGGNVIGAGESRGGARSADLPPNIATAVAARPHIEALLDRLGSSAGPGVVGARKRYATILSPDRGRLVRIATLLAGRYAFPGRLDPLRLAKAIWRRRI